MHFAAIALAYVLVAASFLFLALCGQHPCFAGTVIERLAHFALGGWFTTFIHCIERTCGGLAARKVVAARQCCCTTSHPLLAITYLLILAASYHLYHHYVFAMLPTPYSAASHRWTGTAALVSCVATWATCYFSDPASLTQSNSAYWHDVHPADDGLFLSRDCKTCQLSRPARCKHCSLCGVCVMRHDHHCAWVNNCIGANNLRWFIAFLLCNATMLGYGSVIAIATVLGRLQQRGMLRHRLWLQHKRQFVMVKHMPKLLFQLMMQQYGVATALGLFLAFACLILTVFFVVHAWNICVGITSSERARISALQHTVQHSQACT